MRFNLVFLLLLLGCGSERVKPVPPNKNPHQQLVDEMVRIESQLKFCRGMWTSDLPHFLTGKPECDTGDGMLFTGLYLLSNPINANDLVNGIRYSVDDFGRPWRSPEDRDFGERPNTFSRDMFKGLMFYLIYSKDQDMVRRFTKYVRANHYRMCPSDTDARCQMTPSTLELLGDVHEFIGLSRPDDMPDLGALSELTMELEASQNPLGYQLHLVSLSVYMKALTGNLRNRHAAAARTLYSRQPNNLWFRFLANYVTDGHQDEYSNIMDLLLQEMRVWPNAEKIDWKWQRPEDSENFSKPAGHEYVFLAKLLTQCMY